MSRGATGEVERLPPADRSLASGRSLRTGGSRTATEVR